MDALRFAVRAHLAVCDDIAAVAATLRPLVHVDTGRRFATVLLGELDAGGLRLVPTISSSTRATNVSGQYSWSPELLSPATGTGPALSVTPGPG